MQLTSLSISGFKSFAIDTKIDFAEGVTAVVGPNGCGKSNVVDSLRWVLGEQRSSVLRGDRMENVIFNGTNHRKPLNLAEVRVLINNESGRINLPYSEIELARRLHRDGTSEYLINSNACRLRDITDLLHDSGMGPNMYSILELKMVESILREEGEGRRQLFEEASGIAKYKLRRRQAAMKLQQTEEDLLRLADIIHEVERQVASLKRQVSRARRYKEYSERLRTLEFALMVRRFENLRNELSPLEAAMQKSTDSSESLKAALRTEEAKLEELKRKLIDCEQAASTQRRLLEEVVGSISMLEAEQAGHRATDEAARETIERTNRQRILGTEKLETLTGRKFEQQTERESISRELAEADRVLAKATDQMSAAQQLLDEQDARSSAHSRQLQEIQQEIALAESARTDALSGRASLSGRRESAEHSIDVMNSERIRIESELKALSERQTLVQKQLTACSDDCQRLRAQHDLQTRERQDLIEKSLKASSDAQAVESKLDLLITLEEMGPRSELPIKTLGDAKLPGVLNLLGDAINVDEKYGPALQGILGAAAYYFVTETVDTADQAVQHLKIENAGRATFVPMEELDQPATPAIPLPPGVVGFAMDLVRHETQETALSQFLSRVVIVESWEHAKQLRGWAHENDCALVTLTGEWIRPSGIMHAGSPESTQPLDLGLTARRQELQVQHAGLKSERDAIDQSIRTLERNVEQAEQVLRGADLDFESARRASADLREQEIRLSTLMISLDERDRDARARVTECDKQLAQIAIQIDSTETLLSGLRSQMREVESIGLDVAEQLRNARENMNRVHENQHQCERARDAVRHRLMLVDADLERVEQSIAELTESQSANEQAAEKAANDIVRLRSRLLELESELADKFRVRDARASELDAATQELDSLRGRIEQEEDLLKRLRSGQEDALAGERRLSMDVARLQGEMEALLANARTQYSLDPSTPNFHKDHPELAQVETDAEAVQELRQRIEGLGPVNLMAIEEYEQENTRLDGMLKNREDLLQAKATLEETIKKINETAEAKFLHTFEAVRTNFQSLFLEFFPAGEADLILSGKDLLEADITIWANPSGKRLKSLSLMSGGEKTMTAIALLFSLYRVKPSPFCVLDEVDAPLDDTNIDRFTRMLRHHSGETQFILITHNKRTMEIADNLYGVTMQEEGVSKLVSVRLLRQREPAETTQA